MNALAKDGPLNGHAFTVEPGTDGRWPDSVTLAAPGEPNAPGLLYRRANTTGRPGDRHVVYEYRDDEASAD